MDIQIVLLILFLLASALAFPVCLAKGLFTLPKSAYQDDKKPFDLISPLLALLIYVLTYMFVPLLVRKAILYLDMHGYTSFTNLELKSMMLLAPLPCAAVFLLIFTKLHSGEARQAIWGSGHLKSAFVSILKGVFIAFACYPIVMLLVQCIHVFFMKLYSMPPQDQVALALLKSLRPIPWLFGLYAIAIVTFVPLVEELLFRGYIQTYLSSIFGTHWGIILSSLLFSFFHYSSSQGFGNVELIIGLFFFSCLIGRVFAKKQTLFATIGMHAGFNFLSILVLLSVYN